MPSDMAALHTGPYNAVLYNRVYAITECVITEVLLYLLLLV